ncbi:hypothetical protein IHE45_17G074100 [Dioscorea alata]|uniref:Uncharacterized protein n=3 Tax=Dioscorea alata TaxID=55571 RepID=A0ACB7UD98_DIOAL|nr:hypothetical protein IHE45_17G074100 [Dioscorea alata]KAH7658236.1 hypothetical protein IHE45_17G074100 [Dioscorea alata]KAH7658237.1 hypothetical protein IHE45_17G074100 [Dioscorea alata]
MDDSSGKSGFDLTLSNGFEMDFRVKSGQKYLADTMLRLDSGNSSLYSRSNIHGLKRKWDDFSRAVHAFPALSLGRSPSTSESSRRSSATACTMSPTKEMEEESSLELGLKFTLHLGNDSILSPKQPAIPSPRVQETHPACNLQLSLSTGPSSSVITSITPDSTQHPNNLDAPLAATRRILADDGSTSGRWKSGGLIQPLLMFEAATRTPAKASTVQAIPDLSAAPASGANPPLQRNLNTKSCQFPGCMKGARGASGRCIAHGGGRRCLKPGCNKGAEGKTVFCKAHGGGRRCSELGCTKSAEGRTERCIAHGGGRRCKNEGCPRAARGKSGLCIRHGGGKRCQQEGCPRSAEGHSGLCISHGGGRRCQFSECKKGAQGSTMFCKAHGGGKRCTYPLCNKGAEGSTPFCKGHGGGKRCSFPGGCTKSVHGGTQFCVAHGGGKRCAFPDCTKSARGRTDHCVRHGGGKRCKSEGCGKSAQGSTDFCKAHGGGKRCSWGQPGSEYGAGGPACDRFARGKEGMCVTHRDAYRALIQDSRVHGAATLVHNLVPVAKPEKMKGVATQEMFLNVGNTDENLISWSSLEQSKFKAPMFTPQPMLPSLPEGRVRGGSLMALLASNADLGSHYSNHGEASTSEQGGTSHRTTHKWV